MTQDQLAQLHWMVLAATGLVSALLGAIMHRSHFCTMGAVSDAVLMGSFTRLRQWALAVAVASLGFGALTLAGLISPLQSVYAVPHVYWFSSITGGLLFGWGMVLASGCGSKSLVRLAGGNLKSLLVLLAMGLSALMTLKGVLALPRVYAFETLTWDLEYGIFWGQWLSHFLNMSMPNGVFAASLMTALVLLFWIFQDRSFLSSANLSTGISVGLVIVFVWGISGVMGHVLEHPDTLEEFYVATFSRKMEAISLTAPVAMSLDALLYFSDGTKRLTLGMASVIGILMGAFLSALFNGSLRLESFVSTQDFVRHLFGGCLMGFGAVLAMGCSIGQGLSGLSTVNLPSLLATCAILLGAYLALLRDLHKAS